MMEYSEKEIKAKLAELAKQQGLKFRDEWPIYIRKQGGETWDDVEIARIDHAWYVEIEFNGENLPLPVVAFEIVDMRKLSRLPELKKDLENIRLSGAALGILIIQAESEDALSSYIRERLERLYNIMRSLTHPVRVGVAYAGDVLQGRLPIKWLSTLY